MKKGGITYWERFGGLTILFAFLFYVLAIVTATWPVTFITGQGLQSTGAFGDSFGAFTALFTGLAVWLGARLLAQNSREMNALRNQAKLSYLVERSKLQPSFEVSIVLFESVSDDELTPNMAFLAHISAKMLGPNYPNCYRVLCKNQNEATIHNVQLVFQHLPNSPKRGKRDQAILVSQGSHFEFLIPEDEIVMEGASAKFFVVYRDSTTVPMVKSYIFSKLVPQPVTSSEIFVHHEDTLFCDNFYFDELTNFDDIRDLFDKKAASLGNYVG